MLSLPAAAAYCVSVCVCTGRGRTGSGIRIIGPGDPVTERVEPVCLRRAAMSWDREDGITALSLHPVTRDREREEKKASSASLSLTQAFRSDLIIAAMP